jgi:EAL domain-containing protein (putative c-di-GMP-specific phosphodiesterase class I)
VRTIIALARTLGMDIVAEGTERLEEVSFLRNLGCDYAQGFFFSRPIDSGQADTLLAKNRVFDLFAVDSAPPTSK